MFKKTVLATATAGLLALGAIGATTSAASAGGYGGQGSGMQYGGPGFSLQFGFGNGHGNYHPQKFCKPITKKVKYWRHGHPHWKVVVVDYKCFRPHHNW